MVKINRIKVLILSLVIALPILVNAQQRISYQKLEKAFLDAQELYNDHQYGAAKIAFDNLLEERDYLPSKYTSDAEYYISMCSLKLKNNNAEQLLDKFITDHPEHTKSRKMYFQLANQKFENRRYKDALTYYNKVDFRNLSNNEIVQYYFRTGFALLKTKKVKKAEQSFKEIIDVPSKYQEDALYYYSHINFENGKHEIALKGFTELKDSRRYKKYVPYYLIQSYFHAEDYNKVLEEAIPYLKNAPSAQRTDLSGIIGESYYRINDLANALPYLETYHTRTRNVISRESHYQLGYIYFHNQFYDKALKKFEKAADADDALAQNAHYHLGMCYINMDQKRFAINSFKRAYQYDFDASIKEDALYNYAKLAYENVDNPYSNAVEALQEYINTYPNTERSDEAYSYLINIFLSTNDYQKALMSFDQIKVKDAKINKAYQKIAYNRGIELFNEKKLNDAIKTFRLALSKDYDKEIIAMSHFWIAEAYYHMKSYPKAIKSYDRFQDSKGAYNLSVHPQAYYGKGYSYFMQKKYTQAIVPFRNYIVGSKNRNTKLVKDVYNRLGDCYFISKQYDNAITFYDKAIKGNSVDSDYATYQKALANGGKGSFREKISVLKELARTYPKSIYADDAQFDCGITYLLINNNEEAVRSFKDLMTKHPNSSHVPQALLKTGLVYYDLMQNELALTSLKKVVENYEGSVEAKQAITSIRNIYVELNRVDEYLAYVKRVNKGNITTTEEDSLMYVAAENQYMNSNWEMSRKSFKSYLDKYPNSGFAMNAHFYKADCDFRAKDYDAALSSYEFVLLKPNNSFTESSLFKASGIYLIREEWAKALTLFERLEQVAEYKDNRKSAYSGQMQCNFQLRKFRPAISAAHKLLESTKVDQNLEIESRLIIAKSALAIKDYNQAKVEFEKVSNLSSTVEGAESVYSLAWMEYDAGNLDQSETKIFEVVEKYSSFDYWVAKSFILLSDIYLKKDNIFQAKQTLQSIIDNYAGDDLKNIAIRKLEMIVEAEAAQEQKKVDQSNDESEF